MRVFQSFKAAVRQIATRTVRRGSAFTCGECERWERCGLPPSSDCVIMAQQIERDGDRPVRRASWWRASLGS